MECKDFKVYLTPQSHCVEIVSEGVICHSQLKPGESEDGFWGDDL